MRYSLSWITFLSFLALSWSTARAADSPSYAKHVQPFLAKYCLECHNTSQAKGELVLETFKTLQEGGKSGPVFVPGKPDESRLVLLTERKQKPVMPPKDAKQPKPEEVAVLRAWVAAGAKVDGVSAAVVLPPIKPRVPTPAPVTALAYRPDGKMLAAGGHREVTLLDVASGDLLGKLDGQHGKVTALVFSRDGQRLAVASGSSGTQGEIRLYTFSGVSIPAKPDQVIAAHQDLIHDLSFDPAGKVLASGGYDRLIKLWDTGTGTELRPLKDHSDTIYGLAFAPDGKLLVSAAADRAVKVWDVATGKRLYTLGEATDWLYTVAWHPSGKQLAAAGVDRSIRVWQVGATEGKLVHSAFAHEGPVLRLAYAADGTKLYSLSEDRTVKAWDAARLVEVKVYPKQPEAVLTLAVRPDHSQLALGRYDGSLTLLEEATGKVQSEPLPSKPKPPQLLKLTPTAGTRGERLRVTFAGKYLQSITEITSSHPNVTLSILPNGLQPDRVEAEIVFPPDTPAGVYQLGLKGPHGETAKLAFTVDFFALAGEMEPNNSPSLGQVVKPPVSVAGTLDRAGETDFYRFELQPAQQLGVQVLAAAGSKLEPILHVVGPSGQVVAESSTGLLGLRKLPAGTYALGVRDREYRGGPEMGYRLHLGNIPVVTAVFPLGLERGKQQTVHLDGVYLPKQSVMVKAEPNAAPGTRIPVTIPMASGSPLGAPSLVVGEFPEVVKHPEKGTTGTVPVPGTANGFLGRPEDADTWRFMAKKGERLILETQARRLGSALDTVLDILDAKGQPVPRATLRCQAKTYVTFRDHDSAGANIRIEAWSEFAVNDYVWAGSELLRIKSLPTHPDADCIFFSDRGQRTGHLDTTSTHQPMGQPLYKVTLHPPGTTFPPNGFPVITLPYRNDDGGPGYGKDSRLFFDPPADGEYQVRISDARGHGGPGHAYRLTIRPPRPSFNLSFTPTAPALWKGGALPINVTAERIDSYDGEIALQCAKLPKGLHAPATTIPAGENTTAFALYADANAILPAKPAALKLVAKATIQGQEVTRETIGSVPKLVDPGDIVTTTAQSEVTLRPGDITRLTVNVERRNGFKGRIPLDVRGLPHGVRVLDIGLNGILITEKETSRTVRIYAEPWVQPTEHPIVIFARREGKNTEHGAKSVLLKVVVQ